MEGGFIPEDVPALEAEANAIEILDVSYGNNDEMQVENDFDTDAVSSADVKPADQTLDIDEGLTCPICLEPWANGGEHRVVCLKCGHVFGEKCIIRWLRTHLVAGEDGRRRGRTGRCPQCNTPAKEKDLRPLYVSCLKAIDTAERDRALEELEQMRRDKLKIEEDHIKLQIRLQVTEEQLKYAVATMASQKAVAGPGSPKRKIVERNATVGSQISLELKGDVTCANEGGGRVMAYCPYLGMLVCTQMETNALFPPFGFRKINVLDFRAGEFVPLHSKQVRDAAFCTDGGRGDILLSVGLDKYARLTALSSNSVVHSFQCPQVLWSCCWKNENEFCVGNATGTVGLYDIRHTENSVKTWNSSRRTPITGMTWVSGDHSSILAVSQLDALCYFPEDSTEDTPSVAFDINGSYVCLDRDSQSRLLLTTSRPRAGSTHVLHTTFKLEPGGHYNVANNFRGGTVQKVMSRSKFVRHMASSQLLVLASQESTSTMQVWSQSDGQCLQAVPFNANDSLLDICPVYVNGETFVATQGTKCLRLYQCKA